MKRVKTKNIPTADDDVLRDSRSAIHESIHTQEGISKFDQPRRSLIENGMKVRAISMELHARGATPTPCRHCLPDSTVLGGQF